MRTQTTSREHNAYWKTATCMALSTFYFAMLAYPFGVTGDGYVPQRALIAGVIFFAISIPAWIVNVKKEFLAAPEAPLAAGAAAHAAGSPLSRKAAGGYLSVNSKGGRIGELALTKRMLSPAEIKQILFCQRGDCGKRFGEIAVKRNYLTPDQVNMLLGMQPDKNSA